MDGPITTVSIAVQPWNKYLGNVEIEQFTVAFVMPVHPWKAEDPSDVICEPSSNSPEKARGQL